MNLVLERMRPCVNQGISFPMTWSRKNIFSSLSNIYDSPTKDSRKKCCGEDEYVSVDAGAKRMRFTPSLQVLSLRMLLSPLGGGQLQF